MSLSDVQLLALQADALFTHDGRGRIVRVNEPDGERAPRFFFARSRKGNLWRCRDDLDDATVRTLEALASSELVHDDLRAEPRRLDAFLEALRLDRENAAIEFGPAYRFPEEPPLQEMSHSTPVRQITRADLPLLRLLAPDLDEVARGFEGRAPRVVVVIGGVAVALCFSARLTAQVAEAGVVTDEAYRGRGYARAVVAGWARLIRAGGRIPLYSTSWDNLASQAVARKLGLIQYGTNLSLDSARE